mgnify:CR=1 FL=1
MDNIPTDVIIYAVIAAGLLIWLRNILGTKSGSTRQRPNPFAVGPEGTKALTPDAAAAQRAEPIKTGSTTVDAAMVQISIADRTFDAGRFLENAKDAFAIVVTAFADGDRSTLKDLLIPEVLKSFEGALDAREKAGQKVLTEVLSVREANIIEAKLTGNKAFVTIRFKADETYAMTDKDGKTIAGNPDRVVTMSDVWVFTRDIKSADPRWFVAETRDDVKEEGGMTLPDAGISV